MNNKNIKNIFSENKSLYGTKDGESCDEVRRAQSERQPDSYAMATIRWCDKRCSDWR